MSGILKKFWKRSLKERILIAALVLSLLAVIFPPFQLGRYDRFENHGFFMSKPSRSWPSRGKCYECTISLKYLGIELAGIWLVAGLLYLITNKRGNKD